MTQRGEFQDASPQDEPQETVPPATDSQQRGIPTSPQSLLALYKDWIQNYNNSNREYRERLDAARKHLEKDIHRWREAKSDNQRVRHHIEQFEEFTSRALEALLENRERHAADDPTEALDFRAVVIGVFTAQWLLLRNVAQQHIVGSPYREGIAKLDDIVKQYYARLYNTLTPRLKPEQPSRPYSETRLLTFTPLVYLGNAGELTVFNRRVPLMISVPIAALPATDGAEGVHEDEVELAQMSIPHETAHAIFAQIPELIDEIRDKLENDLQTGEIKSQTGAELTARETIVYRIALEWVEEICADLFGTALAGETFVRSARWALFSSEETVGITDRTHPPAIIRPLVHLMALSTIAPDGKRFDTTRQRLEDELKIASDQGSGNLSLNRRFRSVPALLFVRLETVSTILTDVVGRILEMELTTLDGITMGALLKEIHSSEDTSLPETALPQWGDDPSITSETFILDFPAELFPMYTTPGVAILPDGNDLPILKRILKLLGRR